MCKNVCIFIGLSIWTEAICDATIGYMMKSLLIFPEEPPQNQEFLSLPNLMVKPHIKGNASESINAMGLSAINHLVSFFSKNPK